MKKRKIINLSMVGLAFLVGFFAISIVLMPVQAQAQNIKVGIIDCYSGPAAVYGTDKNIDIRP